MKFDLLKDDFKIKFDTVITKRCLINLGNFENQKKAILKIHNSINKKGYFVMLECCIDGLNNLNILRQKMGLHEIPEPFHNVYFKLNNLINFISKYFYIEEINNFSTYYFLTRVYNQILETNEYRKFDNVAKNIHKVINLFGSTIIGPQFLMVLRKREIN